MKEYYEILGIEMGASPIEIKKAYFSLVRKYPPERFEKEFMEIREAYETLSNEKTKKEYDAIAVMPGGTREQFALARTFLEEGNLKGAIKILEALVKLNPNFLMIQNVLGEAYLNNGNSGKAIKLFEKLVDLEPQNAAFLGHLAHSYLERQWHNKAIEVYEKALAIDEDNVSLWFELSKVYFSGENFYKAQEILETAIKKAEGKDLDTSSIYFRLISLDLITGEKEGLKIHLKELEALAKSKEELKDNVGWNLVQLGKAMVASGILEPAILVIEIAKKIIPGDESIEKLSIEVGAFEKVRVEFERLGEDEQIYEEMDQLIGLEIMPLEAMGMDEKQKEVMRFSAELSMLEGARSIKSALKRLKTHYPELYKVREEFFDTLLDPKKTKELLKKYEKETKKYEQMMREMRANMPFGFDDDYDEDEDDWDDEDGWDEDWEIQEPFIREEPKTGRNDPCPCGSGRKYKKCCGK